MNLEELRLMLDEADAQIVKAFEERMRVSARIAAYKIENGIAVFDPKRENEKMNSVLCAADEKYRPYIAELFYMLFKLSKDYQHALRNEKIRGYDGGA